MKPLSKQDLPLTAPEEQLDISKEIIEKFEIAFKQSPSLGLPPTFPAVSLKGVFQIVNDLRIDWRNLLHATQRFEYLKTPEIGWRVTVSTKLIDWKFRANTHWLQFLTEWKQNGETNPVVRSKTLILVKEPS